VEGTRFDLLARMLGRRSRRNVLSGLAATLGLTVVGVPGGKAGNGGKHTKKSKLNRNAYGCVDVGKPCRGNSANCCSGLCNGKKPKKGKADRSRCVAHNTANCQPGLDACKGVDATCGTGGICLATTGKASFCGDPDTDVCVACTRDTDCEALLGPGAACVSCAAVCPITQGRICLLAAPGS
jgi:hypothetical protein